MTLPQWAQEHFPSTHLQATGWQAATTHHALHQRVLCVARTRMEGKWVAYVRDVPGDDHDREAADVLAHGDKLPETVALALFPEWEGIPYDE